LLGISSCPAVSPETTGLLAWCRQRPKLFMVLMQWWEML